MQIPREWRYNSFLPFMLNSKPSKKTRGVIKGQLAYLQTILSVLKAPVVVNGAVSLLWIMMHFGNGAAGLLHRCLLSGKSLSANSSSFGRKRGSLSGVLQTVVVSVCVLITSAVKQPWGACSTVLCRSRPGTHKHKHRQPRAVWQLTGSSTCLALV